MTDAPDEYRGLRNGPHIITRHNQNQSSIGDNLPPAAWARTRWRFSRPSRSAKGNELKFSHVFLPGWENNSIPQPYSPFINEIPEQHRIRGWLRTQTARVPPPRRTLTLVEALNDTELLRRF